MLECVPAHCSSSSRTQPPRHPPHSLPPILQIHYICSDPDQRNLRGKRRLNPNSNSTMLTTCTGPDSCELAEGRHDGTMEKVIIQKNITLEVRAMW